MAHTVKNKEKEKFDSLAVRVPKILIKAREIFPGFFYRQMTSDNLSLSDVICLFKHFLLRSQKSISL